MKRKRYSEEMIISILKEHEAGASVPDLSSRYGIVEITIYRWKCDNGPEFTSKTTFFWSKQSVKLHFIQPGKPTQNAFVESFNGRSTIEQ